MSVNLWPRISNPKHFVLQETVSNLQFWHLVYIAVYLRHYQTAVPLLSDPQQYKCVCTRLRCHIDLNNRVVLSLAVSFLDGFVTLSTGFAPLDIGSIYF